MERASTTDTAWGGEEGEAPPRKRRIPAWVWWGCGGGCLLVTLIGIALAAFAWRAFREAEDPEKQWPRLGEILAYDERPPGLELHLGFGIVVDQFVLSDTSKGLHATVTQYPSSASSQFGQVMDPDFSLPMGFAKLVEPESGKLLVQGQEVTCLRFARVQPEPPGSVGPGIRVDLSGTRKQARTLELRRSAGALRIEDAEVEAFLAPFDVWRAP